MNKIVIDKKGYNFEAGLKRAKNRSKAAEAYARKKWNAEAGDDNPWHTLGEVEKYDLITKAYKALRTKKVKKETEKKPVKLRRSAKYDIGQHELICEALKVSPSPDSPGNTAYEAVCELLYKINQALEARTLKEAKRKLTVKPESFDILPMY